MLFNVSCSSSNQPTYEQKVKGQELSISMAKKADKKIQKSLEQKKIELNKQEIQEVRSLAEKAKNTCKLFGYKMGSEKFADCAKEIYLKETQTKTASTTKTIIVKNDNSGAQVLADELKRQRRQEAFDELLGISQGLLSGKSLTETLGGTTSSSSSPKTTCFKKGEEKIGFGKSCRYSCVGSLYTMMVGSMEQCPLTVEK